MNKRALWLVMASLLFWTVSLAPSNEVQAQPIYFAPSYSSAYDLIAEVNALRASNGLAAYTANSTLMQIAQAQSEYQASIGTVTHYSADGSRPYQRALAAGYPLGGLISAGGFFSENITAGANLSASQAVDAWMGDAPHQTTMLSPNLTEVGAGVAVSGNVVYYTLDAAAPSGSSGTTSTSSTSTAISTPGTVVPSVQPVITSTPDEDGNVYHEVKAGQALWSIATAYGTTVDEIKKLNQLSSNDIYEGQKLLIRGGKSTTQTATVSAPTMTVTIGVPLSTATSLSMATATATVAPIPVPPTTGKNGGVVVGIIVVVALLAAGIGTWLGAKKSS